MKNYLLVTVLLLAFPGIDAQTLGLKLSPNLTKTIYNTTYGTRLWGGAYYDRPISGNLGFSSGLMFTQLWGVDHDRDYYCWEPGARPACPSLSEIRFDVVEIPVDLTLDFAYKSTSRWKFFLTGGYSLGQPIGRKFIDHYRGEDTPNQIYYKFGLTERLHFFRMGFEIRHSFSDKINMAIGGQYRYGGISNRKINTAMGWNYSYSQFSDGIYSKYESINLVLKTGYNIGWKE